MNNYEECSTKEEVLQNFFASQKNSNEHIQVAKRLSQLGHHDDALKLYLVGMQMTLVERESHMIRDFEAIISNQKAAGTIMNEASETMQGSARMIQSAAETVGEASRTMHRAAGTIEEASRRMGQRY